MENNKTSLSGLKREDFQKEINGKATDLFFLTNSNGVEVAITNYGGALVAIMVPDKDGNFANVIQGHDNIEDCINSPEPFLSTLVGRYGNRICHGKFTLNQKEYHLAINNGPNHLHGGQTGFHARVWDAEQINDHALVLRYISPYYDEVNDEAETLEELVELYTKADFLSEVYIPEEKYETCVSRLKHKKNIILQGAPGVGKTFAARRLAWSIMGVKDDNRIEFVQFHQSYSYEDFIMGYKPAGDGFALENGLFYNFCLKAKNDPDNEYFFIIDEINRGNMSKIFGELLMLIENDYRDMEITLAYDKKPFSVPKNLYIIGMMNTADRSLAMIDYALRRRFSFVEMTPGFDSEGFVSYQTNMNNDKFNKLISRVKALNADIENDASLGKGFCIGHSYFCGLKEDCTDAVLKEIVDYDIIPMLEEYWFDDEAKAKNWSNDLRGVFNG